VRIDRRAELRLRPGHLSPARRLIAGPHVAVVRTRSSGRRLTLTRRLVIAGGKVTVLKVSAGGRRVTGHRFGLVTRIMTFTAPAGHVAVLAVGSAVDARVQDGRTFRPNRGLAFIPITSGPHRLVLAARGARLALSAQAGDVVVAIASANVLRAVLVRPAAASSAAVAAVRSRRGDRHVDR
jgi:hypothetical protein